jgi:hypothetical protein
VAVFSATDYKIVINSVNLSDHLTSAELPLTAEELDTTTFGTAGWRSKLGGLKEGTLTLNFLDDKAASNVDATLWTAFGTVVSFTIKSTTAATSATNPEYQGSILVKEVKPFGASVGDLAALSVSYPTSGTVTRAVSP